MNKYQTACNPQRIQRFLDQKLSDAELAEFEAHLSGCDACRRRLETAVASEDQWSEMRESLRGNQLPADGVPPGDSDSTGEDASSGRTTVLKLLAPTDDDRMLGRWGTYVGMGTGGMGVVLKALDAALNRYVAIKILAPHLGSSGAARKRFSREAQASAAVVHDNVIEIYGVAETAGLPYLVMPYVRGPSVQRRLDDEGPLAVTEILRVGMQAAAGLAAAHAQGLVHRDVKPANILLADGIERVKLTDFGLARAADDASLTKTGVIAGTPQYMSPEQARGEPVDQRSDLFSLGSVLYAMCTGRAPFRAETSYGVLRRITDEEPRPIRELNPEIPDWLCGTVAKVMAKRPDDRFQSAAEVAKLLEECLAHVQQPTAVPLPNVLISLREMKPDSPITRSVMSTARKTLFKGVLAMIATLGIGLLGMLAMQATEPRDIAGQWTGEDWGQITLTQTAPGEYTGTYTDTVGKEKGPGRIDLKWSRIERRYNGTWREGEDDRFGDLSVHLVDKEIHGGLTTSEKSKINPATPRLAELVWTRAEPTAKNAGAQAAQSAPVTQAVPRTAPPRTGPTVTGRVLTEPGGTGVYDATVSLLGTSGSARIVRAGRVSDPQVMARVEPVTAKTLPDGSYSFNNVPPGNYMVGVAGAWNALLQPAGVWSEGVYVSVVDHDVRADDLCLKLPQGVSGTVRDADTGEPIASAQIRFSPSGLSMIKTSLERSVSLSISTDEQGRYRLYVRSPKIELHCDGTPQRYDVADAGSSRSVAVEPGRETTVDFRCKSAPPLAGRVVNPDGTPAKDANVRVSVIRALPPGGNTRTRVDYLADKTDGEGRFRGYMRPLRPLQHSGAAIVADQTAISIEAYAWLPDGSLGGVGRAESHWGEPLARPLEVKLEKTGTVVVRVLLEDGTPAADAAVHFETGGSYTQTGGVIMPAVQLNGPPVVYLGDGRYRITGLIPGLTWRVVASRLKPPTGSQSRDILASQPREIEVKPGQTIDAGELQLEFKRNATGQAVPWLDALAKASSSSGTAGEAVPAPLAGCVLSPDGTPAKGANVRVLVIWPQREGATPPHSLRRTAISFITDSEGCFRGYMRMFGGPAAVVDQGAVSIEAYAWLPDHSLGGVSRVEAPSGVPPARPLEVKLEKTGTAVLRVLLEDGTPAADAQVVAVADADYTQSGGVTIPAVQLDAPPVVYLGDGRYRITGLIPGMTWQVCAFRLNPPTASQARNIEVKPGETIDAGELQIVSTQKAASQTFPWLAALAKANLSSGTAGEAVPAPVGASPVIERVTADADKAVIEGRASKNDKIVFIFGDKEAMSQTFPSPLHFKCTVEEGEAGAEWGPVARVTDADGKELPGMPARILPVEEPVFTEPQTDAFTVVRGSLRFRGSTTRRPDGTVIVADGWASQGAPFDVQRVPFGVKLVPAAQEDENDRTGATVSGRVLTEPGGTGVAGARVGLCSPSGSVWFRYTVTAADGTYTFDNVPPGESLGPNRNVAPDRSSYEAWIEAAPDRPPGVWSEAVSVAVQQQDVRAHDLYLTYPQSISGTVRDADTNQPIAGAVIIFSSNEGESNPRALRLGANRKVTDAQGRYRLYVRTRKVTVSCAGTPDRYNPDDVHRSRTVVAEPQQETAVDFCCESGAPLAGRVVNPDGTPAKDTRVRVSVSWPVRHTDISVGLGGGAGRGGSAEQGPGGDRGGGRRAKPGAGGDPDRLLPRTENWSVSFEAKTDGEGRFGGYMRRPNLPDGDRVANGVRNGGDIWVFLPALPVSIRARAWLPDRSLGGAGQAEAPFEEPLARPLLVTLEKTGAAVVRVLFQDGRPVPDAEIRADGFYPDSDSRLAGPLGRPVEYLGDGRYRIAGLTAGLNYRLRAFRRILPTRIQTGQFAIKPGQTTDAGELRLEWEEGLAGDAQPRFRLENRSPVSLAFSPDGATLASFSAPAAANERDIDDVKLIDVATGKVLETGHIPVSCMAFLPKSDRLALGCSDGTVVLTNQRKLTTWRSFSVSSSGACPVAISPNGAMLACDTGDGAVGCWDVISGRKMHSIGVKEYQGAGKMSPLGRTAHLAFSPDNKLLVAVDRQGLGTAWDLESEKALGSFQSVYSDGLPRVNTYPVPICFCPDGKTAAITFNGAEPLKFWDPRGGKPPVLVSLPDAIQPKFDPDSPEDGPMKSPGLTALSPDCKMAATVLYSGWVAVWDVPSRRVFQVLPASHSAGTFRFRGLAFSPDGRLLATGNTQGVVEVWEINAAAHDGQKSGTDKVSLSGCTGLGGT